MKMKFFIAYAVVIGLLAFEEIQAEAKIEASAGATKPFAAEQNFNLLKQFGHEDESKLDQDYYGEGSGWGDDEDDDDYDDEEYYDDDDDDYYDDDDDDDLDFGSGDDQLLHELPKTTDEAKLIPDHQEDLHFAGEDQKKKNSNQVQDSDLLYEYYNELLFGEDEQDDLDYLDEVEQDLGSAEDNTIVKITNKNHNPKENSEVPSWNLQPSYIFLMLTSALITFAIVVLAFILCRKSMISRQHKTKSMPFVISSVNSHNHHHQKSSPIVKNYQRVPTSTKELMQQQHQHQSQLAAEMGLSETQKPLL